MDHMVYQQAFGVYYPSVDVKPNPNAQQTPSQFGTSQNSPPKLLLEMYDKLKNEPPQNIR